MTISFAPGSGINIAHPLPQLHQDSWVEAPVVIQGVLAPHNLIQVGAFTGVYGGKLGHCKIGRYCSIAPGVDIASDQHPSDWFSTSMVQYVPGLHGWGAWLNQNGCPSELPQNRFNSNEPVEIGNDVWIGQGVFIKSGVKIGDGAIIAAHSVVISDVPPYAIVAGVPGRIKKFRFSDDIIGRMAALQWWNYNLLSMANQIDFSNVESALDVLEEAVESEAISPYLPVKHMLVTKS